ncbi:hypothetical protein [Sinorhizobium meliloti]|uniref:hypothetical protein n=1 Tax=Rhizobium meliloti TaxID=382 RepID=UPI000FD8C8D7|nr:hypothetical protein [Sinorhizobium meliloti]RVK40888.1 hypothetical protein CN163_08315 [Sinorhizobium meliloti]
MTILRFGEVTVHITSGLTMTRLPDGDLVPADHREQPGQAELARELGYPDAVAMNAEHDAVHSLVSHWLGLDASPTLKGVASGQTYEHWREEEAVIFALCRWANAAGIDLMEVARRWSDAE